MTNKRLDDRYELVLVNEGEQILYRGRRRGTPRNIRVDRVWEVRDGERVVGSITYDLITREQRTPGKMYVNSRWQSPGWRWNMGPRKWGYRSEAYSQTHAIENIIREDQRS